MQLAANRALAFAAFCCSPLFFENFGIFAIAFILFSSYNLIAVSAKGMEGTYSLAAALAVQFILMLAVRFAPAGKNKEEKYDNSHPVEDAQ